MKNLALFIAIAALGSGVATAQSIVVQAAAPSQTVSFADLNLGSPQGVSRLTHRIRSAASDICLESNIGDLKTRVARSACYKRATSGGLAQMQQILAARNVGVQTAATTLTVSAR
jgi:UrcA family protein